MCIFNEVNNQYIEYQELIKKIIALKHVLMYLNLRLILFHDKNISNRAKTLCFTFQIIIARVIVREYLPLQIHIEKNSKEEKQKT